MRDVKHEVIVQYVANNRSFGEFMMSESVGDAAKDAGRDIVELAQVFAPESAGPGPHYIDQFEVHDDVVVLNDGGHSNPRRTAEVRNTSAYASSIEFGEAPNPKKRPQGGSRGEAQRPLGKAAAVFPGGEYRNDKTGNKTRRK